MADRASEAVWVEKVPPHVARRHGRTGIDRSAVAVVCRPALAPPPLVRRPAGNREDHGSPLPRAGPVRGGVAPELPRDEQLGRARDRYRPDDDQGVCPDLPDRGRRVQAPLPRRGGQSHVRGPGLPPPAHGAVFGFVSVHPLVQLFVPDHRPDPVPLRGVPIPGGTRTRRSAGSSRRSSHPRERRPPPKPWRRS